MEQKITEEIQSEKTNKFKIGDKVIIEHYGHPLWVNKKEKELIKKLDYNIISESDGFIIYDMNPELIGQVGIIYNAENNRYALNGPNKSAWYDENQLKLVE